MKDCEHEWYCKNKLCHAIGLPRKHQGKREISEAYHDGLNDMFDYCKREIISLPTIKQERKRIAEEIRIVVEDYIKDIESAWRCKTKLKEHSDWERNKISEELKEVFAEWLEDGK